MKTKMIAALRYKLMLWHALCHPFAHPPENLTTVQQARCEVLTHNFVEASRRFKQAYGKDQNDDGN